MQYPMTTIQTVQPAPTAVAVQPTQPSVPPPASTTVVITSQPTPPPVLTPLKDWTWGLFDVPDCELFALSWFCPCLVFGSSAQAVGHSYVLCCVVYVLTLVNIYVLPLHILLGCFFRGRLRRHYRIRGNVLCDLFAYVLCCPCTLNQEALQADTEQRAQTAALGASQGLSIHLGSRVINLQSNRTAQPVQPVQVPLLAPTVPTSPPAMTYSAPPAQPVQPAPVQPPTAPPYPTGPNPALGFVASMPAQA